MLLMSRIEWVPGTGLFWSVYCHLCWGEKTNIAWVIRLQLRLLAKDLRLYLNVN